MSMFTKLQIIIRRSFFIACALVITGFSLIPSAPPNRGVVRAILECDKIAVDNGSLLTDNEACVDPCSVDGNPSTDGQAPSAGVTPGPIYLLGDSIGIGLKRTLGDVLPANEGWSITGDPKGGRPLLEGIDITNTSPPELKGANVILVVLGTNNLLSTTNATDIPNLVTSLRNVNNTAPIFWVSTNVTKPTVEGKDDIYNAELKKQSGITIVENTVSLEPDGIHPSDYPGLANAVKNSIVGSGPSPSGPASNSAADLAKQMLVNNNITYWTNNGVNTRDVVVALSQGKKAYTTATNAPNKEVDINVNILKFILEVAQGPPGRNKIMVNALTDKTHTSPGSKHYSGQAVDLDNNGSNSAPVSVLDPIAQKYGGKRNSETTHWHYEFEGAASGTAPTVTEGSEPVAAAQCCVVGGGQGSLVLPVGGSQGIYRSGLKGPYIVEQFIEHTLKAIAQKTNKPIEDVATQEHIVALIAFSGAEGGGIKGNQGQYNLFNTKLRDADLGGTAYETDNGRDDETMNYPTFDQGVEATARTMVSNKYQSRLITALTDKSVTAEKFMEILTYYDRYPGNKAWAGASDPKQGGNPATYLNNQLSLVRSVRENYAARAGIQLDGWTGGGEAPKPTGSGGQGIGAVGDAIADATQRTALCGSNPAESEESFTGDTFATPCAIGTDDLDEATGYKDGKPYRIRLCAIPGLTSVDGKLKAKVNSTASQKWLDLYNSAKRAGYKLVFNGEYSTFRTMEQQQELCTENKASCDAGFTAQPGKSNHQMGFAIDFNFDGYNTGSDRLDGRCKIAKKENKRCELGESATWRWMKANAGTYGIKQLWFEYWHWGTEETNDPV